MDRAERLKRLLDPRARPYVSARSILEVAGLSWKDVQREMRRISQRQLGDWLGRPFRGRN